MGIRFIKMAVIYLFIGIAMGMFMSMSHQFNLRPVHTHVNLLGWASMGLAGILYVLFPAAGESKLGKTHFWLHNIGLPVMMLGLAFVTYGKMSFEPLIAIGATITSVGIILFTINILKNTRSSDVKSSM